MRKRLFERYVDLACHRIAIRQLYNRNLITYAERRGAEKEIEKWEIELLTPKQGRAQHPRTLKEIK